MAVFFFCQSRWSRTFDQRTNARPLPPLFDTLLSAMKYILVAGGVVSGIGKGVIGANVFTCHS